MKSRAFEIWFANRLDIPVEDIYNRKYGPYIALAWDAWEASKVAKDDTFVSPNDPIKMPYKAREGNINYLRAGPFSAANGYGDCTDEEILRYARASIDC